jgi:hypothetical protein
MMKNKFIFFLLIIGILPVAPAFSQALRGTVTDEISKSMDYFKIEILNYVDSSVLKTGIFVNGTFIFDKLSENKYIMRVSSLGFHDLITDIDLSERTNLTLQLKPLEIELQEVVVSARMPAVINKDDRYVVEIENTSLSDAGNAIDAISRTPFVIVDKVNGDISVAGKNSAIILINNRKITNKQELEMLFSQNIKQIEVIENPSAKYEAEGHSVINIVTKRAQENGLNVNLQSQLVQGRHTSERLLGSLTYIVDKWLFFTQYGYNHRNDEGFNSSKERYEKPGYSFCLDNHDIKNLYHTRSNTYAFGINFEPGKNHSLGLKYDGFATKINSDNLKEITAFRNTETIPSEIINRLSEDKPAKNGFTFNYNFNDNKRSFSVIGDYTTSKNSSSTTINEEIPTINDSRHKQYESQIDYTLYSVQTDVKIPIELLKITMEAGIRLSNVKSDTHNDFCYLYGFQWINDERFTNSISFEETIIGSYISFAGKIGTKTQYQIGLRNEYAKNRNDWNTTEAAEEKTSGNILFPSILLFHKYNENTSFRLSYSKRISRPPYESLNNSIIYDNSYAVTQGNPYLKSTLYNTLSLSSQLKRLNMTLNISHIKNPNELMYLNDSEQIEIHTVKRLNTESRMSYSLNANYTYNYKKWTLQPFLNLTKVERSIVEDGIKYSNNKPGIYFSIRNNISLMKSLDVDFDMTYNKPAVYYKTINDQYEFNLSIRQKLFKDRLTVRFSYNYIPVKWEQFGNYSYKYIDFVWDGDDRKQLILSLTYNFNTAKRQFKSKSSAEEEIRRM